MKTFSVEYATTLLINADTKMVAQLLAAINKSGITGYEQKNESYYAYTVKYWSGYLATSMIISHLDAGSTLSLKSTFTTNSILTYLIFYLFKPFFAYAQRRDAWYIKSVIMQHI